MMKKLLMVVLGVFGLSAGAADPASVHGMLIFGGTQIYVSHLPMYHRPHDYQAIVKVSLGKDEAALKDDMAQNPNEPVYTIEPEKFVLPDVIQGLKPFKAVVYRGHFERGGKPLFTATLTPTKVIVFNKLNAMTAQPDTIAMLVFGEGREHFAAHVITKQPNFDQVLTLNPLTAAQKIAIDSNGGTLKVLGASPDTESLKDGSSFNSFGVKKIIYTETGDLE